jgi:hypothetical protein
LKIDPQDLKLEIEKSNVEAINYAIDNPGKVLKN